MPTPCPRYSQRDEKRQESPRSPVPRCHQLAANHPESPTSCRQLTANRVLVTGNCWGQQDGASVRYRGNAVGCVQASTANIGGEPAVGIRVWDGLHCGVDLRGRQLPASEAFFQGPFGCLCSGPGPSPAPPPSDLCGVGGGRPRSLVATCGALHRSLGSARCRVCLQYCTLWRAGARTLGTTPLALLPAPPALLTPPSLSSLLLPGFSWLLPLCSSRSAPPALLLPLCSQLPTRISRFSDL